MIKRTIGKNMVRYKKGRMNNSGNETKTPTI